MIDTTELAKHLVELISPALPFLVKVGEKVAEKVSADAVKALGESTWDKAKNIWVKLSPQFQQEGASQQAIAKVLQHPDEVSKFALISEVRDILEDNPDLAQELRKLMKTCDLEHTRIVDQSINWQTGGVSIRGDVNNTGTFIAGDQVNLGTK
jgi:uncharacterized protein YecE (DUF72 family)